MNWIYEDEVNRCLLCEDAPCTKACIKNLNPAKRIRSLYFDNPYGASDQLPKELCGECEAPCEKACILSKCTKPIEIKNLMEEIKKIKETEEKVDEDFEVDLSCDICGVKLENPFMLSSSVVGSNFEMIDKAFTLGWGGVSFKTICLFEQYEASPRYSALKSRTGSIYGFKNIEQLSDHALEENLSVFKQLKDKQPNKVIIASIMGRTKDEWEYLARACSEAGADVIELNFSCPNMEDGTLGVTIGQDEELIEILTRSARKGTSKPILAKMTPNVIEMSPYAIAAKKAGANGIAAINTIKSITGVNIDTLAPEPSVRGYSSLGGYSGPAVKPIALRFIAEMATSKVLEGMHLSAMGGIESWRDGLEFILLGAGSLQVSTSIMQYGYRIIEDLTSGLKGYMRERNIHSLKQLIGAASTNVVELNELERNTILFPKFNLEKCIGCGRCYISCYDGGHQAIKFDYEKRTPSLNGAKCVGCHLCKLVCPTGSISIQRKRITR